MSETTIMSLREKIEAIFNDVILKGEDADVREYDKEINGYQKDSLDDLYDSLLEIMKENENVTVRKLITEFWSKKLVYDSKNTPHEYWSKLSKEARDSYKKELFKFLTMGPNFTLKEKICDIIGGIIITMQAFEEPTTKETEDIPEDAKEWPEIPKTLETLVKSESELDNSSAYLIMAEVFANGFTIPDVDKKKIEAWFKTGLQKSSPKVQLSAIQLLFSLPGSGDDEYTNACCQALPIVFEKLKSIVGTNPDLHRTAARIFRNYKSLPEKNQKKHFGDLFEIAKLIFNKEEESKAAINQDMLNLIAGIIFENPSFIARKKKMLEEYAKLLFYQVAITTKDVTEEWARPPERYNEEKKSCEEDSYKKLFFDNIDILASVIPQSDQILNILEAKVKHELDNGDWKAKYFDLMIKSQIGEYIDLPIALKIIESSLIHLKDPHPKVRYATLQLIGQYCEDLAPEIQHACPKLLAILCEGLAVEEVPRVISHYFAGFLNFFDKSVNLNNLGTVDLQQLINLGLKHSLDGISFSREAALTFVGGLSDVFKEHLAPYTTEVMEVILKLAVSTGKEYMLLRGRALETATLWANDVSNAKAYGNQIMKLIIESMNDFIILDEQPAPLKMYVVNAINRLFRSIPQVFEAHIPEIFPRLIDLIQNMLVPKAEEGILSDILKSIKKEERYYAHDHKDEDHNGDDGVKEVQYGFDEVDICCNLQFIHDLLSSYSKVMVPYAEKFEQFFKKSLSTTQTASGSDIQLGLFHGVVAFLNMAKTQLSTDQFLRLHKEFFIFTHNKFENGATFTEKTSKFLGELCKLYSLADNTLNAEGFKVAFAFIQRTNIELARVKALAIGKMNGEKHDEEYMKSNFLN